MSGSDYDSAAMNLTFPAGSGDGNTTCLSVMVNDDSLIEGDQIFNVNLELLTVERGVALGSPTTTAVTIVDDESNLTKN